MQKEHEKMARKTIFVNYDCYDKTARQSIEASAWHFLAECEKNPFLTGSTLLTTKQLT